MVSVVQASPHSTCKTSFKPRRKSSRSLSNNSGMQTQASSAVDLNAGALNCDKQEPSSYGQPPPPPPLESAENKKTLERQRNTAQ
eukprot:3900542-Amphidinium_carterae.1